MTQREIKFRVVFEDAEGEIRLIDLPLEQIKRGYPMVGIGERIIAWLEYTGLHDKNGKEIYHKDRCATRYFGICVVEWHKEDAMWILTDESGMYHGFYELKHPIEVIDNVYENPELIEAL